MATIRISQDYLERLIAGSDIVRVISGYLPVKRVGSQYRCACPFCFDSMRSLRVNPETRSYSCSKCRAHGSVVDFLISYLGVNALGAMRDLAGQVGIPFKVNAGSPESDT